MADIAELVAGGRLPPGSSALQDAYKLLAREVDRAEKEGDRWGKAKAVAEMRATWVLLVGKAPDGGETEGLDEWVANLPAGAVGDTPKRCPADARRRHRPVASGDQSSTHDAAPAVHR